jgi:hypothetical protein
VSGRRWSAGLRCRWRSYGPGKLGNGSEHLAAIAERNFQVFEVLVGQMRGKTSVVDVVLGKMLLVPGQPERA